MVTASRSHQAAAAGLVRCAPGQSNTPQGVSDESFFDNTPAWLLFLLLLLSQGMYDKLDQLQPLVEQLGKAHRMKV